MGEDVVDVCEEVVFGFYGSASVRLVLDGGEAFGCRVVELAEMTGDAGVVDDLQQWHTQTK